MIKLDTHTIEDCPICGRPAKLQSWYIGQVITCSHCLGHFVLHQPEGRALRAVTCGRDNVLARAERLLQCDFRSQSSTAIKPARCRLDVPSRCGPAQKTRTDRKQVVDREHIETATESKRQSVTQQPTALLVEHRDEVFARIATDLAEAGLRVIRAKTVVHAMALSVSHEPMVVVANVDLPDQNGWLLAGKISFIDPTIRVWLYQPRTTDCDAVLAAFMRVHELFEYGGDLLSLSETILQAIADHHELNHTANNPCDTNNLSVV